MRPPSLWDQGGDAVRSVIRGVLHVFQCKRRDCVAREDIDFSLMTYDYVFERPAHLQKVTVPWSVAHCFVVAFTLSRAQFG